MTKGTTSQGPRHLKAHTFCRRCGRRAFHRQKKECGACGFPRTTMRRYDGVYRKVRGRKGQGSIRRRLLLQIRDGIAGGFRILLGERYAERDGQRQKSPVFRERRRP